MLRDLLIDQELFEILRTRSLESDDCGMNTTKEVELLEKAVFNRLKKKRSVKKYKKLGVTKGDLKQIIQLADIMGLDTLDGPSNYELAMEHEEWCTVCGRCCRESESVFIHRDELNLLLTFNSDLEKEIIRNKEFPQHFEIRDSHPCKFIDPDNNKCAIYTFRPQVCRNYPLTLIGSPGKAQNSIHLSSKCNYSVNLILKKSIILFDEAIQRLEG
jgi:hypothetical protein